jgi:P63C domain
MNERSKGGNARAEKLSPEERTDIASKAARARWTAVPQVICGSPDRPLCIGQIKIDCYVLDDGTRVLTQASFLEALGRHRKARVRNPVGEDPVPAMIQGKSIKPFVNQELREKTSPIIFCHPDGGRAKGYRAEVLPDVCEVYLRARDEGVLPSNQQHVAKQAEILIRGLARVGIIALVDEATGYQEFRTRDALSRILEAFIAKELQPWISTFPGDFYQQLFRLRELDYPNGTVRRPQYFGHLTNDLVYKRIAPGVLEKLKEVTPYHESGRRKHKYFQRLTSNVGYPKLKEHLGAVVAIMKLSTNWTDFMDKIDRICPRYGETMRLPFGIDEDDGKGL